MVVARAGQAQEGGVGAGLAGHDRHAEGLLVERDAALEVGHEQDGVVEADGVDGHGALPLRCVLAGGGQGAGQAMTAKPPVQDTFSVAARVICRKPIDSSSRARDKRADVDGHEAATGHERGDRGLGVGVVPGDQDGGGLRRPPCRRRGWRRTWC